MTLLYSTSPFGPPGIEDIHVGFVVGTDLLHSDVVLGVYEGLCGGVGLGDGHHTCNVLEVTGVVHFHLEHRGPA